MASSSSTVPTSAPDQMEYNSTSRSKGAFDGVAPSASSSASKRTQKPCYDVFINHRGPDVKHTLASVLYGILTGMSLSVFLDSQELEYGDILPQTIEAAMATALLHIAIFSKGYADSPWCLAELTFMLNTGAKIIPIFYHVDPSDLRWVDQGKGMYAQAFKDHERKGRYSKKQLQEWKAALHNISFYSGQIINSNKDEMRLLKNIVDCVMKEINNSVPLEVAKNPVGMKEIVEDFKVNTLGSDHGSRDLTIIGIWGMGGSGKTTLAKALYNEISSSMQRSSFVFNVRDAATKGLLHEKQRKLLNDLGIPGLTLDNVEDGKRSLSRGLRSGRVLIVLDDVDNIEQLDAFLFTKDSFQRGSIIIVTTRAYDILKIWGISSVYKMRSLDPLYAKQLFCWHAFLKSYPADGFEQLVEKFLVVCNGLPLSLKIFGAQLFGEFRIEYWESQLNKIVRILPDDIKQRLKISYDALDDEEKEMFLDTACFFIGQERSSAIEIWNGLGYSGLQSWERLLHKCLVELDNDNQIRMHDHLRDLGRNIAHNQIPYRLWVPQQSIFTYREEKERIGIQGMITTSIQMVWLKFKVCFSSLIDS